MIIIYHQHNKVTSIWNQALEKPVELPVFSLTESLFAVAKMFPCHLVVWCHLSQKNNLNIAGMADIFHHQKIMASYNCSPASFFSGSIGYMDESPFITVNKSVPYATWQMSAWVGGIAAAVLTAVDAQMVKHSNFDYFLHSLAKLMMPQGLLCYSSPRLLLDPTATNKHSVTADTSLLFKFVKQHFRVRWTFILVLNFILYERKVPMLAFWKSLFYRQIKIVDGILDSIILVSSKKPIEDSTIDVIIPTIGRKKYLYDILCDFRQQTHLPNKIIIVEQNPLPDSATDLDYIGSEQWPFEIKHVFTHQTGACNARNIALEMVDSAWVFLADDDIRIEANFLEKALLQTGLAGNPAVSFNCFQEGEKQMFGRILQWPTFGSGCSMVRSSAIESVRFNIGFEHGFGEDGDFGMQLRNTGNDVLYLPEPAILHLKAPVGGFRTQPTLEWHKEGIQPKPSPTIMYYKLLHQTRQQLSGYKTILFFKFYRRQSIRNPIRYYKQFQRQWERSLFWAKALENRQSNSSSTK